MPDLDAGLRFYRDGLVTICGGATTTSVRPALAMNGSDTEIVLSTQLKYEPHWLVTFADAAALLRPAAGVVAGPLTSRSAG